jgi:phosphopantetheine adenylyltransferase
MIVVSKETQKAGDQINDYRKNAGLKLLDVVTVDILDDHIESDCEQQKVSSGNYRMRMLGEVLKPPRVS